MHTDRRPAPFVGLLVSGLLLASFLVAAPPCAASGAEETQPPFGVGIFPQGVAAGDVTSSSAVLWTRTDGPRDVVLEVSADAFEAPRRLRFATRAADDFTVHAPVADLPAASLVHYRFSADGEEVRGRLRTAPPADADAGLRLLVGGDLGGHGYCRSVDDGYPIFRAMAKLEPDLFIANGDMIYADGFCPAEGPEGRRNIPGGFVAIHEPEVDWTDRAALRQILSDHWRYNRADAHHRAFLARVPMLAQWDDHEAINDFGLPWPAWPLEPERPGWRQLLDEAQAALIRWNPIARNPEEPRRIYRSLRWGRHVEIFLLDARSYRSPNRQPDGPDKTLLGAAQRAWIERAVIASDATWKVLSFDVPLSLPTGSDADVFGRDGFAAGLATDGSERTGAERELRSLLTAFDAADVENLLVVATDVHHPMFLRYDLDLDGDGDRLRAHELLSGPLSAVAVVSPLRVDPSLRPTILYGEGGVFNFLDLRFEHDARGRVRAVAAIRGQDGAVRPGGLLVIEPATEPAR